MIIYKKIIDPIEYVSKELVRYRDDVFIGKINLKNIKKESLKQQPLEIKLKIIKILEKYNIFFSYPLDFDYLMLKSFADEYKKIYESKTPKGGEPNVIKHKEESDYEERLNKFIQSIFSSNFNTKDSIFSTIEEKELLAWHKYLFSDNKPTVHFLFLSQIDSDDFIERIPNVLKNIKNKINKILS